MKAKEMAKAAPQDMSALRIFLILFFIWLVPGGSALSHEEFSAAGPIPQVLVIHSYYATFTWADNITKGIRKAFADNRGQKVQLCFEFLDAKRHPEKAYLDKKAELLQMKYPDPGAIDIIICSDDQALNFLLDRSDTLFSGIPVVFCGVNAYSPGMRKIRPELTGVIEAIDPRSTLEAALQLQPHIRKVLVINDITLTGQAIEKTARQAFAPFEERLDFHYVRDLSMPELQARVSELTDEAIVFLFVFNRDNRGRNFTHEGSLRRLAGYCPVPIYGPWTFYLGQGIIGGMLTSGEAQGMTAAQIALRILQGEQARDIPVIMESPNRYMFDYRQLVRHHLPLHELPEESRIINQPVDFYQKYRYQIWVAVFAFLAQTAIIVILLFNIRRRRRAEKALSVSEQRYRTLVETITDGVFTLDTQGNFTFLNPVFEKITGYSIQSFLGRHFTEVLSPESIPSTTKNFKRGLAGQPTPMNEVKLKNREGNTIPVEINMTTIMGPDGTPTGRIGVARDIADRKNAEKILKESEEKFRTFFNLAPQAISLTDKETGRIVDVNPMFCTLSQYSRKELIGKKTVELGFYSEYDRTRFLEQLAHTGEVDGLKMAFTIKDGTIRTGLLFARMIYITGTKQIFTIILDITEQQRLEAQLQHAKKMEAIGTLAGGVAHDLNNVLSAIVSYPDLILMELPENSPLREAILTIKKAGERAAAIVDDLLTLARRGVVAVEVTNLNEIIMNYLQSPECKKVKEFHPNVAITSDLENNLLNVMGSPFHLTKMVMNMVSNAAEAMPDGGKVIISTRNEYMDKPVKGYDDVEEGDYVVLRISDTGVGMSPEERERIFEPFYTKKVMGKSGTGLGMAVVWGTVKDHKGYVDIQSEEGKGTTLTLYFPVTRKELTEKEKTLLPGDYLGQGESILVVDDIKEQRELATVILKKLGYAVTAIASGEEAVEYLAHKAVDLLILDMIMAPGMDGLETYKKVLILHPGQKAIIASGFSETERVKEAQALGAGRYIKKPYTLKNIGMAVKEELAKKTSVEIE